MFEWIQDNSDVLNTLANFGMLGIWVAYLQLFLQSYRRQRRAHILINRGAGRDLDARCLIGNMSSGAVYVETIVARLFDLDDVVSCAVTDVVRRDEDPLPDDPRAETRQGPLSAGGYVDIGSFRSILDQVALEAEGGAATPADRSFELEVLVIAAYASENRCVGARRRFQVQKEESGFLLKPCTAGTEQVRGRHERLRLETLKQEYL